MKVLGIVGSKRKKGNTSTLVQETLKAVRETETEVDTELIFLGDYDINSCHGCEGCKDTFKCIIKDDMQKLYPLILESSAIVLGSPTYFYNISSDIKAFLERCYNFEVFDDDDRSVWMSVNEAMGGKYAVAIAVCEQDDEKDMGFTAEAMTKPLEALGYRVVDTVKILELFKMNEASKNDKALEQAKKAGEKLAKTLKLRKQIELKLKTLQ
ncbi:flavodoxin family protein [Vallitalea okinawensis]|uniref:flavodoxin family protein n=1 Tax=Vallitalea okinawensis TaxID=2078660 RepID=UPI000CFBCB6C|nr:flavodoxin family protein [Vallitalea okinawensis]